MCKDFQGWYSGMKFAHVYMQHMIPTCSKEIHKFILMLVVSHLTNILLNLVEEIPISILFSISPASLDCMTVLTSSLVTTRTGCLVTSFCESFTCLPIGMFAGCQPSPDSLCPPLPLIDFYLVGYCFGAYKQNVFLMYNFYLGLGIRHRSPGLVSGDLHWPSHLISPIPGIFSKISLLRFYS